MAQLLFHEYENEFEEVAWIDYQGNLKKSFLTNITAPQLQNDNSNDDERWYFMESRLKNDGKKKLFIIDNVDNEADQHPKEDELLQELTGWEKGLTNYQNRLTIDNLLVDFAIIGRFPLI